MKRNSKHLLAIRLITGITLFFFGFFHLLNNDNFIELLRITEIPLVYFNAIFIPLSDFLIGIFLILGAFTRISAAIGLLTSGLFIWIAVFVMNMDPSNLPDGLTHKPFYPHVLLTIIVALFNLYLTIFGGGALSLDNRLRN